MSFKSLVNKLMKEGKSKEAATKIAGKVASEKMKGAGSGPTAKQKARMKKSPAKKYDRVVLGGNKGDKSKTKPGKKDYDPTKSKSFNEGRSGGPEVLKLKQKGEKLRKEKERKEKEKLAKIIPDKSTSPAKRKKPTRKKEPGSVSKEYKEGKETTYTKTNRRGKTKDISEKKYNRKAKGETVNTRVREGREVRDLDISSKGGKRVKPTVDGPKPKPKKKPTMVNEATKTESVSKGKRTFSKTNKGTVETTVTPYPTGRADKPTDPRKSPTKKTKQRVEQDYARNAIADYKAGKKKAGNYEKKKALELAAGESGVMKKSPMYKYDNGPILMKHHSPAGMKTNQMGGGVAAKDSAAPAKQLKKLGSIISKHMKSN